MKFMFILILLIALSIQNGLIYKKLLEIKRLDILKDEYFKEGKLVASFPHGGKVSDEAFDFHVRTSNDKLLAAIIQTESAGDDRAIGDQGQAVGILQIHPVMVEDINRILGWKDYYTLHDRYNPQKSIDMYYIYMDHYCQNMSDEYKARCWNGGPTGYLKPSTQKYWEKVKNNY